MLSLESLLSRGYFPKELPPPFSTRQFGQFISRATTLPILPANYSSSTSTHNLARTGSLRRKLGIPNPISYTKLASCVISNTTPLFGYLSRSKYSLTKPQISATGRALDWKANLNDRPLHRAGLRSCSKYILQADVSRFYQTIYTHSIPWALYTKAIAKVNRSHALFGNEIDHLVQYAQDKQTLGIPIGPDTSLLISEIILAAVDEELFIRIGERGFRYADDYEFGFKTIADADRGLGHVQEVLSDYELALNPSKTKIVKLPQTMESAAISELRGFRFRNNIKGQLDDITRFFDRAFVLSNEEPAESVLKYAISRISGKVIFDNWPHLENILMQCCMSEPGALELVLYKLLAYKSIGYSLNLGKIEEVFNEVIKQHAPQGHGSEVAWALWGLMVLNRPVSQEAAPLAALMNDSVVAILMLDAHSKGLAPSATFQKYQSCMTKKDLEDDMWLLAYQANYYNWLPSVGSADHVAIEPFFSFLKLNGISFYDSSLSTSFIPTVPPSWSSQRESV